MNPVPVKELQKKNLRQQVVDYMYLISLRNAKAIEEVSPILVASLENEYDASRQGLLHFVKGITCFFRNNYDQARTELEKIFELPLSLEDADIHGIGYMGLGLTHRSAGHLDEAVTNLFRATQIITKAGPFKPFLVYCFQQLGDIHVAINEYENAVVYFTNAYDSRATEVDNLASFRYHMGLGDCYLKMKDHQRSEFHLLQAQSARDLPPPMMSRVDNDLGELYVEMCEFDKAEVLLVNSLKIRESHKLEDAACTSMTSLAEVFLHQNKTGEALAMLHKCLELVDKYQTKWKKIRVLHLLAKAYTAKGECETAVRYYEEYNALYEKIKSEQERNIFKFKNAQIERQKQIISEKHRELAVTLEEIKRLKVNQRAAVFSWTTIIILVIVTELFLDPFIDNYAYNNFISLTVKVLIACLFKPLDGLYEKMLWKRTLRKPAS